ncbi:hypothetical protein JEO93_01105 [Proteus mirabilis]|nr:hypothetical protein [Proteus mirabilis]
MAQSYTRHPDVGSVPEADIGQLIKNNIRNSAHELKVWFFGLMVTKK